MAQQLLNPDIEAYIENLNKQLDAERTRRINVETQLGQGSLGSNMPARDQTIVDKQLELEEFKDKIYHLLSGHEVKIDTESKSEFWEEADDDRLRIFSPYGMKLLMNQLSIYVNINTLMGYYDEETIKWKVRDFGIELSDLFLNRSETLLYYPTPEELYERYKPIMEAKGLKINEEELYNKCVQWSEEELAAKENLLPIICLGIVDIIHSTYTRAFKGKERTSLGERGLNISQTNSGDMSGAIPQKKGGIFGFLKG